MDQGRLLMTLEGYGAGPHMRGLLAEFWGWQGVLSRKNGYHSPHFQATRGTIQGGIILPTLFNIVVDNVVWNLRTFMVEDELVAYDVLGLVIGRCLGLFYANHGMVGSRDMKWFHVALNVLIGLFRRYGLV